MRQLPTDLTDWANNAARDRATAERFLSAVYDRLRAKAHREAAGRPGVGEGPTEVVHEVLAEVLGELTSGRPVTPYKNRRHIFRALYTRIEHKVIDLARGRRRLKRGGGATPAPLDSPAAAAAVSPGRPADDLAAIDEAFADLRARHGDAYRALVLRNQGHTVAEVANQLDVSPRAVVRWSKFGTAFLYARLVGEREVPPAT